MNRSQITAPVLVTILSLPALAALGNSAPAQDQADLYPNPEEARAAYDWIHKNTVSMLTTDHPGFAVSELEANPRPMLEGQLADVELSPGWATFGLVVPEGRASDGLEVDGLETQTDIKTRWLDGSIRFAVVTARVQKQDRYRIFASGPSGAAPPLTPSPQAEIVFQIADGEIYSASLVSTPSTDSWLSGPLVSEWRSYLTPVDSEGVEHPFLRVVSDYRIYRDGQHRRDIAVENVLNIESATSETYNVKISIDGQTGFEFSDLTHWYLTRWRKIIDAHVEESNVRSDFEPAHLAGAVPRFLPSIVSRTYPTNSADYEILGKGGNTYTKMGSTGGRSELACYPDSTAVYLVHRTQNQLDYLLMNGDLAGSWPVHIREADGSFVTTSRRPEFWLDHRGEDKPKGDLAATGPLRPDNAHQPSWAYVPYLVTGDRYYADEMAFWANYVILQTWPFRRGGKGAMGFGENGASNLIGPGNQTRGFGWGLRNLADAAAYLPDSHQLKPYLTDAVTINLEWADFHHSQARIPGTGVYYRKWRKGGLLALWAHNYLAWAVDHAHQQGFTGGERHLRALAGFQSKLFTSDPVFKREYGSPYQLKIGEPDQEGNLVLYESMEVLFENNRAGPSKWNRDYAASARLMLIITSRPRRPTDLD